MELEPAREAMDRDVHVTCDVNRFKSVNRYRYPESIQLEFDA
jgi:hypothetical protein